VQPRLKTAACEIKGLKACQSACSPPVSDLARPQLTIPIAIEKTEE
jgi:hypothetical protein